MLTRICLCIMLMTMIYMNTVNAIPVRSEDTDIQNKKLSDAAIFDSNHFLFNRHYDDDNIDEEEIFHDKRQSNKKWAKFYQGAQSPYTIAFPALIRTRRWIE